MVPPLRDGNRAARSIDEFDAQVICPRRPPGKRETGKGDGAGYLAVGQRVTIQSSARPGSGHNAIRLRDG
jgi:hypothetical protein